MALAFIFSTSPRLVLSVGVSSPVLEEKSRPRMVNFCTAEALEGQQLLFRFHAVLIRPNPNTAPHPTSHFPSHSMAPQQS